MSLTNLAIAKHLKLESTCYMERVVEFQHVYLVVFAFRRRPTFVSRKAIAQPKTVVKPILRKQQPIPVVTPECEVYRVVKTWDNGGRYSAGRVISVLIQPVDCSERPFWESVMLSQGIERNDILKRGRGRCLVKVNVSYADAIATYA